MWIWLCVLPIKVGACWRGGSVIDAEVGPRRVCGCRWSVLFCQGSVLCWCRLIPDVEVHHAHPN